MYYQKLEEVEAFYAYVRRATEAPTKPENKYEQAKCAEKGCEKDRTSGAYCETHRPIGPSWTNGDKKKDAKTAPPLKVTPTSPLKGISLHSSPKSTAVPAPASKPSQPPSPRKGKNPLVKSKTDSSIDHPSLPEKSIPTTPSPTTNMTPFEDVKAPTPTPSHQRNSSGAFAPPMPRRAPPIPPPAPSRPPPSTPPVDEEEEYPEQVAEEEDDVDEAEAPKKVDEEEPPPPPEEAPPGEEEDEDKSEEEEDDLTDED